MLLVTLLSLALEYSMQLCQRTPGERCLASATIAVDTTTVFKQSFHGNEKHQNEVDLWRVEHSLLSKTEKKGLYDQFYNKELEYHGKVHSETLLCLKKTVSWSMVHIVMGYVKPGLMYKVVPEKMAIFHSIKIVKVLKKALRKFVMSAVLYLDMIKDTVLLASLIQLVGVENLVGPGSFQQFPTQVVLLLAASITLPILLTNISLMLGSPKIIFGYHTQASLSTAKQTFQKVMIFLLGPLTPALLLNNYQIEADKLSSLYIKGAGVEEVRKQKIVVETIKRKVLSFKTFELVTEVSIQLSITWIMILLINTETKTISGFEIIFQGSKATWRLVVTAVFSLTSVMTTYLRIQLLNKNGFIETKGKLVLALRSLFAAATKVACMVIYFSPFMGLFSLLFHLEEENKAPFQIPKNVDWSKDRFLYAETNLKYSDIYRYIYKLLYIIYFVLCVIFMFIF